jgi:hypothetical protein
MGPQKRENSREVKMEEKLAASDWLLKTEGFSLSFYPLVK